MNVSVAARRVLATGVVSAIALGLLGSPGSAAAEQVASITVAAPAPKARPAKPSVGTSGVTAIVKLPNGITRISHYEPAPGVTVERLHAKLKARKVPGLQRPGSARAAALASCALGTATTLNCPAAHWSRNGHAKPQIYFVDHSTGAWPVSHLVPVWHQTRGIDSRYRSRVCPSIPGIHCVGVHSGNFGAVDWLGHAVIDVNTADNTFVDGAYVEFNDFHPATPARKRKTVCHELGHILGLGHSSSANSCMVSGESTVWKPHADDYNLLAAIYSSF